MGTLSEVALALVLPGKPGTLGAHSFFVLPDLIRYLQWGAAPPGLQDDPRTCVTPLPPHHGYRVSPVRRVMSLYGVVQALLMRGRGRV